MKCKVVFFCFVSIVLLLNMSCFAQKKIPENKQISKVWVLADKTKQEMEGFGASGSWWAQDVGGWPEEKINKVLDLLYSQDKGIGLSIYRYNIAAGKSEDVNDTWRTAETYEIGPGVYDWNKDANAVNILQSVAKRGIDNIVACAYSPPARMTNSGTILGHPEGKSNLRSDMYNEYAKYLIDIVEHLIEEKKIPISVLSPLNEPEWEWVPSKRQEGCHYEPEEVARLTEILLREIKRRNLNIDIEIPECGHWKGLFDYLPVIFSNDLIDEKVKTVAVHSYFGAGFDEKQRTRAFVKKNFPDKELHMSEYCVWKWPNDMGMESAMILANVVYEDIVAGGVVTWQWWLGVSRHEFCDGLVYVTDREGDIKASKRLWAFGNYTKFVRPGYKVIESKSDNSNLKVSAFAGNNKFVIVIVNNEQDVTKTGFRIKNTEKLGDLTVYETSSRHDLEQIYKGEWKNIHKIAPKSVTTLIVDYK